MCGFNAVMPKPRYPHVRHELTRHGVRVWYFRRKNGPRTRLRGDYGSEQWIADYESALAGAAKGREAVHRTAIGTLGWLISQYRGSSTWSSLATATRNQRDNIFLNVVRTNGDFPLSALTRQHIIEGRERRARTAPHQANNFIKSMRGLFRWALDAQLVDVDPTAGVKPVRIKTDGFQTWTEEELARFESHWPIGTRERLALDILLYTGLRRGDAVRLGRQHVRAGIFRLKTEKNGVEVEAPLLAPLIRSIEASPTGDLAFIAGVKGRPMVKEAFGTWFRAACKAAGVPGAAHGLRKVAAIRAAEAGATTQEMNALFGWTDGRMATKYTEKASRAKLARAGSAKVERMR